MREKRLNNSFIPSVNTNSGMIQGNLNYKTYWLFLFALHETLAQSAIGLCMKYQHETSNQIYALPSCESFGYFLQPNINQAIIILKFAICIVLITSETIYVPLVA